MNDRRARSSGDLRLRLATSMATVRADAMLADPDLAAFVIDDLCWRLAMIDLESRACAWWQLRMRRRWRAEYTALRTQRAELRECARRRGLAVV